MAAWTRKTSGTISGANKLYAELERKHRRVPRDFVRLLARRGIRTFAQLSKNLERLEKRLLEKIPWLLDHTHKRIAVPMLLCLLADKRTSREASCPLSFHAGPRALNGVLRIIDTSDSQTVRKNAVYTLAFMIDENAYPNLYQLAADETEHTDIRWQAVEGIAYLFSNNTRRTRRYIEAEALILSLLRHKAPSIRFWSCFAAGTMRLSRALRQLKRMTKVDRAMYPGMWRINQEAADAVFAVKNGYWPDTDYMKK